MKLIKKSPPGTEPCRKTATPNLPGLVFLAFSLATVGGCSIQPPESRRTILDSPPNPPLTTDTRAVETSPSGTVTSGGSLIYGDRINPWFTSSNSTHSQPTWCLKHDARNFGPDLKTATNAVKRAITAWEPVAGVRFQKLPECSAETDLTLLMGSSSDAERAILAAAGFATDEALQNLAGVTVQTQAGTLSRKGKGLIYIAPAAGPMAIKTPDIISQPWTRLDGKLLEILLLHELGHVFGLQHNPGAVGLMGQRTVEQLLNRTTVEGIEASTAKKYDFDQLLMRLQPSSLVGFADIEEFEKCRDDKCTKIVLTKSGTNRLLIDLWTAPEYARNFWGTSGYTLENSGLLSLQESHKTPVTNTRNNGIDLPGILSTTVLYSGNDSSGNPMTVQWTSGQMPRVISYDGTRINLIID